MRKMIIAMFSLVAIALTGLAFAAFTGVNPALAVGGFVGLSMLPLAPAGSLATATITVSEMVSAFGTYIGQNTQQIIKLITQPTVSQNYMTTIATKDLEYRMAKAVIDDVVQGFQEAFTPKGTAEFTPRSITQRRHKLDLTFYPDEIVDSWLGFLATQENVDRKQWPITRYIIEMLIVPKVLDNRELKLIGKGNYAAVVANTAQATGLSMDGFCTQLEDAKASGTSNINFITLDKLTTTNIFDQIELFAGQVDELYQNMSMNVFVSRSLYRHYMMRRRDLHGLDQNYSVNPMLEGTNMTLVPLPSMSGKDIIFATPKENFLRVINRNDGASNIAVENVDRQIKVYADWYEAVGFGIEEAVFASVPAAADSGSL